MDDNTRQSTNSTCRGYTSNRTTILPTEGNSSLMEEMSSSSNSLHILDIQPIVIKTEQTPSDSEGSPHPQSVLLVGNENNFSEEQVHELLDSQPTLLLVGNSNNFNEEKTHQLLDTQPISIDYTNRDSLRLLQKNSCLINGTLQTALFFKKNWIAWIAVLLSISQAVAIIMLTMDKHFLFHGAINSPIVGVSVLPGLLFLGIVSYLLVSTLRDCATMLHQWQTRNISGKGCTLGILSKLITVGAITCIMASLLILEMLPTSLFVVVPLLILFVKNLPSFVYNTYQGIQSDCNKASFRQTAAKNFSFMLLASSAFGIMFSPTFAVILPSVAVAPLIYLAVALFTYINIMDLAPKKAAVSFKNKFTPIFFRKKTYSDYYQDDSLSRKEEPLELACRY